MSKPIPSVVRHEDVLTAIQPLLDLVGVDAMEIFADPPLSIGHHITFTAHPQVAERTSLPVIPTMVGNGDEFDQHAVTVSIPLDLYVAMES